MSGKGVVTEPARGWQTVAGGPPALIAALLRPTAYPGTPADVQLRETHLSWIFLSGDHAYKVKKPVDLGFVDFSTIERRAAACAEEVRLNRRLCPDVYLGVVEIVASDGGFRVGGPGRPVEPAVKMRRLPEGGMLPALIARGAADAGLLRRLARQLAHFHASAATGSGVDEWGSPAAVRANWAENFAATARFVDRCLPAAIDVAVRTYVDRFLIGHADSLAARIADGHVRDGHGDLHAGNICVEGRRIHLFDRLEFSPRYRCADVAADVAFLAMDLERHGRADLGATFVDAYVRASGDAELGTLLDFYKCYRAWVRGKVLALQAAQPAVAPDVRARLFAEARGYFDLAWAAADGLLAPVLVVALGLPASGKTSLARALAGRLGLVHLSSDLIRKELAARGPTEHRKEGFNAGIYTPVATRRTYAALRRRAARWLDRGRTVVLDASFGHPAERAALRRLASRHGARLIVFHCRADEATILARLGARERDPLVVSDARLELWPALRAAFTTPDELPGVTDLDMTAPPEVTVARALAALGAPG